MPKIQLAVQGGGAKVFALLAALDAIQQLGKGKLEVTRIAGTSAGALAASLFAAGINLKAFRDEMRSLAPKATAGLSQPGLWEYVRLLWSGKPFWSSSGFETILDQVLKRNNVSQIADTRRATGTELLVVSSDLDQSRRIVHSQEDYVVNAVADSCGIPFCFRTWVAPNANKVDGGILENLPVEMLMNDTATHGPVFGISFRRARPNKPQDIMQFSLALLDAAIDNSVDRALQRIGSDRVFLIDCPYGTFDFNAALNEGLGALYDLTYVRSKEFFEVYLDPVETNVGDPWKSGDLNNMLRIGEMYEKQHKDVPLRYLRLTLDVTVNSLEKKRLPDVVDCVRMVQALDEPVYCHAIALSSGDENPAIQKTQLIVFDVNSRQEVETVRVYMKSPSKPNLRYVLLCFVPPLSARGGGSYSIQSIDHVIGGMEPLVTSHRDELRVTPTRARGTIDRVEFIARVPERYSAIIHNKKDEQWGQPMTDWDLRDRHTPGFRTIGWYATNLDSSSSWGVELKID